MKKKLIALLMVMCMMTVFTPTSALAVDEASDAAGAAQTESSEPAGDTDKAPAGEEGTKAEADNTGAEKSTEPSEVKTESKDSDVEAQENADGEEAVEEEPGEDEFFTADRADYLSYDPLFIAKYASDKYVNIESLDMNSFINIVAGAKGIAGYTIDKDKSLDEDSFIAGMTYELPIYDIDAGSKYYVAIPNVNKFNGTNFRAFGLTVGYNNEFAETIDGWKYENGILYIPKSAVDNPKNKHDVPEGEPIAVQLNYAIGSDTDFSKTVPVQVLTGNEPKVKKAHADNIFDADSLTVKTGVKGRKAGDIAVFLNGQLLPINSDAWNYNSSNGELSVQALPGVVSNINIVFKQQTAADKAKGLVASALGNAAEDAYAVSQDNMTTLHNEDGKEVVLTYDTSKMFVGWRGHYSTAIKYKPHSAPSVLGALDGYTNSVKYLYGGTPNHEGSWPEDAAYTPLWSIQSYAVAGDTRMSSSHDAGALTWNEQVTHYYFASSSQGTMTIYEWMMTYRNTLKKSDTAYGGNQPNGIGGVNNFAAHWPVNKVIEGSDKALAHPDGAPKANPDITFSTTDISASQWYAASCSELGDAAESDEDGDVYVTCLGLTDDYIVLAFVQARSGQNMTAIYKFRNCGYVQLTKTAQVTDTDYLQEAPNNYSLAGAKYELYTNAACTNRAKDSAGNPITLTTNANGKTEIVGVAPGTYYAKEVKASKGFAIDKEVRPVTVTAANTKSNPAQIRSVEVPVNDRPNFKIYKYDPTGVKGWDRLINAEYTISYYDITVPYGDEDANQDPAAVSYPNSPTRSWTFKTRKMESDREAFIMAGFDWAIDEPVAGSDPFYTEDGERVLPAGYYTIRETKSPVGAGLNEEINYGKVYQKTNGSDEATNFINGKDATRGDVSIVLDVTDEPQKLSLKINKLDKETGEAAAQGSDREHVKGSLAGAVYEVYYDNDEMSDPELVGKITTDENGVGTLTKRNEGREEAIGRNLEVGEYTIKEVTASPGYVVDSFTLSDGKTEATPDRDVEVNVTFMVNGEKTTQTIKGIYKDGAYTFNARAINDDANVIEFGNISQEQPHHTIVYKKDAVSGEELPGATLQVIDSEGNVVEQWVSTDKPHDIVALHDETQGLKDGKYTLREITAPYGYDIAEDVEFEVKSGVIENKVEMKNKPITVGTMAMDEATKTHQGTFGKDEVLVDKVKVTGLYAGRTYVIKGVLMDKNTGEAVKDAEGREVTAESEPFEGKDGDMEIEVKFNVNSEEFTTDTVTVVFEKLYRAERFRNEDADFPGEDFPKELQKHEDIDDEAQTIHYGGIVGTTALDKASKSHNILAGDKVTIVDTVKYENLSTQEEYEVKGELYDKTTGKLLGVKGSAKFTPKEPSGTVDVEFTFDATQLKNHDLVVFEQLWINGALINKHENPDDEDQTVHVPEIHTTATDTVTNDHIANGSETVRIKDVVEYKNLIPGKTYTMEGTLMNKQTGKPVVAGGKTVKASKQFTPSAKDGSVEIEFVFNGVDVRGTTTVAFEECTVNSIPVAVHADINDEAQTVEIPIIGTKAALHGKNTIVDKIGYKNLIPGRTYTMRGVLMDKKTKKPVTIDGDKVTGEVQFTPQASEGIVEMEFEINAKKLRGKTLVAFEKCYIVSDVDGSEIEIASHENINSKAQSVKIPKKNSHQTGQAAPWALGIAAAMLLLAAAYLLRRKLGGNL